MDDEAKARLDRLEKNVDLCVNYLREVALALGIRTRLERRDSELAEAFNGEERTSPGE